MLNKIYLTLNYLFVALFINALMNATIPEDKKDLHSFFGLVTYCSRFIDRSADDSNELWPFFHKYKKFELISNHQKSFDKIRLGIKYNLSYFNVIGRRKFMLMHLL